MIENLTKSLFLSVPDGTLIETNREVYDLPDYAEHELRNLGRAELI